jgi:glycosyltransferase involved in cell wall biosynthesis
MAKLPYPLFAMTIRGRIRREITRPVRRSHSLSIVIPVFNESGHIARTIQEAAAAAAGGGFKTEFVVVDDGSTDGSGDIAESLRLDAPIRVVRQPNRGRIAARRAGLAAATSEYTMFLDSRVRLEPDGLAFIRQRLDKGERVWNSHVTIDTVGNPFGKFWKVLVNLVWPDYLARPRTMSFGADDFDRYPKGTAGFIAPTELLKQGFTRFDSYYEDERYGNDDTSIIRWIAGREPINISPHYACTYAPRTTLDAFMRHAFHRGIVFLDGHGRRESRFFPAVIAFYPISLAMVPFVLRRPKYAAGTLVAGMAAVAGVLRLRGFPPDEAASFAALAPLYAVAHGAGMWKGLAMLVGNRLRQAPR